MTTLVIILVLVVIAVAAVATIPYMIHSARRRATVSGPRQPGMGSPAQVWVARGERVLRELEAALADHEAWRAVADDAAQVVAELRVTGSQVAEVDHALSQIADPELAAAVRLRDTRTALLSRMESAVTGLETARAQALELIATAATLGPDPDPVRELNSRLAGLRAGLVEVRGLSDPEAGSGIERDGQGHP